MIIIKYNIPKQPRSAKHIGGTSSAVSIRRAVSQVVTDGGASGGGTSVTYQCPFSVEAVSDVDYPIETV